MATYDEIARDVSNWANRDTGVLDYDRIKQCLVFAHDEIYRTCRIAAIEGRLNYDPITEAGAEDGALAIPTNAVEFIQLRKTFDGRGANSAAANRFTVAEARNDIRSFYGDATSRYSNYSYSRERDRLLVYPGLVEGEEWQLYYYYRFEDPFERVAIIKENLSVLEGIAPADLTKLKMTDTDLITRAVSTYDAGREAQYVFGDLIRFSGSLYEVQKPVPVQNTWDGRAAYILDDYVVFDSVVYQAQGAIAAPAGDDDPDNDDPTVDTTNWLVSDNFDPNNQDGEDGEANPDYEFWGADFTVDGEVIAGALEENWFRDANEKALLFGALHQVFDYLDESDQSQKFKGKFEQEIAKLNDEERRRQIKGGNVQTNFYSVLI